MADVLSCDFETFNELDLKKVGAHKYAMHTSADAMCLAMAFNDEEPFIWIPPQEYEWFMKIATAMPSFALPNIKMIYDLTDRVFDHIVGGGEIRAWNAAFERLHFKHVMGPKYGWPVPDDEQYACTMTEALAMGLPAQLGQCADAMGLPQRKDSIGSRIMLQLCRPRKITKMNLKPRYTPLESPGKFRILYEYCAQDVRTERAAAKNLVRLHPDQKRWYHLAQKVNDRGVPVDIDLINKAEKIVDQQLALLDRKMTLLTGGKEDAHGKLLKHGVVTACSETKALAQWLGSTGLKWPEHEAPSVARDPVFRLLAREDLTDEQRAALLLRQEAGKTSTAKLGAFKHLMCDDGTIKGSLQPNGASTGRDAARGVQVQNFPRPTKGTNVKQVIEDIKAGYDADLISVMHGHPLGIVADILRGCLVANAEKFKAFGGEELAERFGSEEQVFRASDLSQIEARMTAYLAGEPKVLNAFKAFDRKEGPDIYTIAAAGIYNVPPATIKKDSDERQAGKVSVLALGFGGGVGAFASMAKIYQLDLRKAFTPVWSLADSERRERAQKAFAERGRDSGMSQEAWLASELIKLAWREDNPNITAGWKAVENAAVQAVLHPGTTHEACKLKFRKSGSFLRMVLPSGRSLFFPSIRVESEVNKWGKPSYKLYFYAVDSFTRRWMEFSLWGGTIFQNAVQAASFDVMRDSVERLERAGYPNVMRVHDEAIARTRAGFGSLDEYNRLFTTPPLWAPDLPVAGEGWEGPCYRK